MSVLPTVGADLPALLGLLLGLLLLLPAAVIGALGWWRTAAARDRGRSGDARPDRAARVRWALAAVPAVLLAAAAVVGLALPPVGTAGAALVVTAVALIGTLGGSAVTDLVMRLAGRTDDAEQRTAPDDDDPSAPGSALPGAVGPDGSVGPGGSGPRERRPVPAGMLRGGVWIGTLERAALIACVLGGASQLLIALVAIKALGRYPELRTAQGGLVAEQFIIGTLASLLWAGAAAGTALTFLH